MPVSKNELENYCKLLLKKYVDTEFIPEYSVSIQGKNYRLDFYSPEFNIAIEIDGKYHKSKTQKLKDMERQKKIESHLNCKFYRYNTDSNLPFYMFCQVINNRLCV